MGKKRYSYQLDAEMIDKLRAQCGKDWRRVLDESFDAVVERILSDKDDYIGDIGLD